MGFDIWILSFEFILGFEFCHLALSFLVLTF